MTIHPESSFIMLRILPRQEKIGSILTPPSKDTDPAATRGDLPAIGEILAVGEGWRAEDGTLTPMSLKVGQYVLLNGRSGIPVFLPDQGITVWFLREREILAIVNNVPVQES